MAGKTDMEFFRADMVACHFEDIFSRLPGLRFAKTQEDRVTKAKEMMEEFLPKWLAPLETILKKFSVIILANPKINNKFQYFKFNLFFIELDLNKFKHIIPIHNFSSGILHKILIIIILCNIPDEKLLIGMICLNLFKSSSIKNKLQTSSPLQYYLFIVSFFCLHYLLVEVLPFFFFQFLCKSFFQWFFLNGWIRHSCVKEEKYIL